MTIRVIQKGAIVGQVPPFPFPGCQFFVDAPPSPKR